MTTITRIPIRGYHEDRFGHVNNARYLELLEEARWAHLEKQGLTISGLEKGGVFPVVVRLTIAYRRPATAGDVLEISTELIDAGRRRAVIGQTARFAGSDELCVEAEITAVFLDIETGRPVPLTHPALQNWPELTPHRP
jgi:thioesterase-3